MPTPLLGPVRRVGPYRLLGRIGAGGMGEVFLAQREAAGGVVAGPLVAVKTVRGDLDPDGQFRVRFRREIAAARAVTGPCTAALVDGDADAELPWLATEYVAGPALSEAVARCGPLPVPAVRALGAGLAGALTAVHGARVLHRDLKPANVLLAADGPRLIDFGIAQAFDATALTATGLFLGTPGYMSPEHLTGSHAVSAASDVFCLGAVLCCAATGRGPFDDEEPASVLYRIASGAADLSALPPPLRDVVTRCLDPDPAARPTAPALAAELTGAGDPSWSWPASYLSLIAEHREAVLRCEQAAGTVRLADAATTAGTAPPALVVPPSPTAPGARQDAPPPPVRAARDTRRRWPWLAAVAALVTAVAVTVAVLLPEGTPAARTPGAADGSPAAKAKVSGPVAVPDADAAHSGEFTAAALDRKRRPTGWRPWARRVEGAGQTGGCTAGAGLLVCGDGHGAARALDLATGREKWRTKGFDATRTADDLYPRTRSGDPAIAPVTDGTLIYVPARAGIVAVEAATGRARWWYQRTSFTGLLGLTYADGRLYVARIEDTAVDASRLVEVQVLRASDGQQQWLADIPDVRGPLVVRGRTVYMASAAGGVVALDTGAAPARSRTSGGALDCAGLLAHDDALLCWSPRRRGITVLDPATLTVRRTLATSVTPAAPPLVGDRGVLLVRSADDRLHGYDWRTGARMWAATAPRATGALALAGRRLVAVGRREVRTVDVTDGATVGSVDLPAPSGLRLGTGPLAEPLVLGGGLYLTTHTGVTGSVGVSG
ncbi:PQQ-binding-like beta-propeller repeat protein [Streptomyces sp. NPDC102406]|uniref:serine/threonine-protein kinase n=1 Tax=Streptomyces sp. NPDC102406 TaxID=3366171 RepID=UPI0037F35291